MKFSNSLPPIHLVAHNSPLTLSQLEIASKICQQALLSVQERDEKVRNNELDSAFALPDANWSYNAPNEFVQVFRRLTKCEPADIAHLRGFSQVFSGYNLYQSLPGEGLTTFNMEFDSNFELAVEEGLKQRNQQYVEEWKHLTKGLRPEAILRPAAMLGEVGHQFDGVIINNDTCTYQERINLIVQSGLLAWLKARRKRLRICEIGGGYGALCRWFLSALPSASYTIIDLPESLLFSRLYVTLSCPGRDVRFVPNYKAGELDQPFDLIINTLSMSEMSEYQVRTYLALMKTYWLKKGGLFFEQNQDNLHIGLLKAQDIIATELPHHMALGGGQPLRNGYPNLWSLQPIDLNKKVSIWRRLIGP
jgi:hypothetical protein